MPWIRRHPRQHGRCEDEAFKGWVLSGRLEDGEGSRYGGIDVGFWRVEPDDGSLIQQRAFSAINNFPLLSTISTDT